MAKPNERPVEHCTKENPWTLERRDDTPRARWVHEDLSAPFAKAVGLWGDVAKVRCNNCFNEWQVTQMNKPNEHVKAAHRALDALIVAYTKDRDRLLIEYGGGDDHEGAIINCPYYDVLIDIIEEAANEQAE